MPIREFTDENGMKWRVWQTYPARGSAHPEALRDGWLTFECADGRLTRQGVVRYAGDLRLTEPIQDPDSWDGRLTFKHVGSLGR